MKKAKRIAVYAGVALMTFLLGISAVKFVTRVRHPLGSTTNTNNTPQPIASRRNMPWEVLLSFQNQDLKNLPTDSHRALQQAIDAMVGPQDPHTFPLRPRMFRTISNTNGRTRYILVKEKPLITIPGESRLRVYVFDTDGKLLSDDEFSGGWRTCVTGMSVERNPLLQQDALIVNGQYWVGDHTSHQHYVVVGDRIVPAYGERDGELKRYEYLKANVSIAPSIP